MPSGQFVVSMDPGADQRDRVRSWYESERIPAILAVPGVAGVSTWATAFGYHPAPEGGMRKEAALAAYVAVYDLEDVDAVRTPAFLDANGHTFASVAHADGQALPYETLMSVCMSEVARTENPGSQGATPGAMMVVSVSPRREYVDLMHEWYDTVHFPELLVCPGFQRARRYRSLEGIPNHFAFYDLDRPEVLDGEHFRFVSGRKPDQVPPLRQRIGRNMTHNMCDVYRRLR